MAQSSDLDQAFEGMTVQEVSISPTLKKISTDHIFGKITCDRSYPSTSSSSPKFLVGVNEDIVVANDWDQYVSTHSNSPTSNWEIEHLSPPSEKVLVVMDYPSIVEVIIVEGLFYWSRSCEVTVVAAVER
ncbi:hypothetical protein RHSIM_RhsimUnG0154400 [Rhododendron simsii]|uniref:Uncharacterized protein n=1 Tax=Rhododendron simsii TaxID=118357 RepID=A0A834FV88_RHOSS|nr:hypothetical protein RHSIM_RhsimUnG0154400 [Rhododendron simsii]